MRGLSLLIAIPSILSCNVDADSKTSGTVDCSPDAPPIPAGTGFVLTSTYETSSLDVFSTTDPSGMRRDLVLASGDTALRPVGKRIAILNRGDASNLMLLDANATVLTQLALPGCGPHDVISLPDCRLLVACYEDSRLRLVDPAQATTAYGPDLAAFADVDGKTEVDQLLLVGNRIYVTLQNLDRDAYSPAGPGLVAVIAADTLEVLDVRPGVNGIQAWELPRQNPYTAILLLDDGRLAVGCAGNQRDHAGMGVVALSPLDGATEVLFDGDALGGPPSLVRRDPDGAMYALITYPDAWALDPEMRLIRLEHPTPTVLYAVPGFKLSGLAFDSAGLAYVGNRTADATNGVWRVNPTDVTTEGPFATGLPPLEVEIFR